MAQVERMTPETMRKVVSERIEDRGVSISKNGELRIISPKKAKAPPPPRKRAKGARKAPPPARRKQ